MDEREVVERIGRIEAIVGRDPEGRRGVQGLLDHGRGGLPAAARSVARHPGPHVGVMTGFYLTHGQPPACETDGPPGAAHVVAALHRAGIPCRLVTDVPNQGAVRAAAFAAGLPAGFPVDVASVDDHGRDGGVPVADLTARWLALEPPVSHVVAIERCGPAADGVPRNAHGVDLSAHNAPLERLYTAGRWTTIGIGDGGNEIGMGSVPKAIVAAHVRNGERIACTVPCDHLLLCGVSNWGGLALVAALAVLRPDLRDALLQGMTREADYRILEACVHQGPAVSVPEWHKWPHVPVQVLAVDGLPWEVHAGVLDEIRGAALD